ncbi:MAG TPA: MBL fold metallo-hydrolase [Pseudonocardiaceae bacterium]|nr:MBL fold metallo-hydrolase [Pseudonocardiaceae bacterium]
MGEQGALREIADGVYAWVQPDGSWWVNNAGAVAGADGLVLIDTCATETRTRRWLGALAEATGDAPIRLAVSTHHHGDHTYGNSLLPAGVPIVAHEGTREAIAADAIIDGCPPFWSPVPQWGAVSRRLPTITVTGQLTLFSGPRRIEVRHPGYVAHTVGDVVAYLPDEGVLFTGDLLFHQVNPLIFMGSLAGALRSLDWLAGFQPRVVVPGHGPLIDGADLADVLTTHERYYRMIQDAARTGIAQGLSPLDAAKLVDLGEFAALPDAERVVLNLHRAYAEATGADFDIIASLTDAVAFNGGPLPTSV